MAEEQDYLLGMAPAEVRRLEQQHATWRGPTRKVWELAGFARGQTLADLGCGPGFTAVELADLVGPEGRVIAVDSSAAATEHLRVHVREAGVGHVQAIDADVMEVDLSPYAVDGVFARWLLWFLPDPEAVIQRVAAGLGAGARLAVMDYWNYRAMATEPAHPLFAKVFGAVYDSLADAGGSLDVAGKVPRWFEAAGLEVIHVEPFCQVGGPGSPVWQWVSRFQDMYLPTLVEKRYLTGGDLQEYQGWWQAQSADPCALLFAPPLLGVVGEKRGSG